MNIAEKIYYSWVALLIPLALLNPLFDKDEHPIVFNIVAVFILVPIAILFVLTIASVMVHIWK